MSSLSPLSHLSLYATGTRSGGFPANAPSDLPSNSVAPSVRESRSTGNAKGEVPSETGSQAVRATDESEDTTSASSRGGVSEDASRTGQQARTTYQNIAGFGPGATSSEVGLLPVSA